MVQLEIAVPATSSKVPRLIRGIHLIRFVTRYRSCVLISVFNGPESKLCCVRRQFTNCLGSESTIVINLCVRFLVELYCTLYAALSVSNLNYAFKGAKKTVLCACPYFGKPNTLAEAPTWNQCDSGP